MVEEMNLFSTLNSNKPGRKMSAHWHKVKEKVKYENDKRLYLLLSKERTKQFFVSLI